MNKIPRRFAEVSPGANDDHCSSTFGATRRYWLHLSVFHRLAFVVPQTMLFPLEAMINGDVLLWSVADELDIYQEKLRIWEAPPQVTEPVKRLTQVHVT